MRSQAQLSNCSCTASLFVLHIVVANPLKSSFGKMLILNSNYFHLNRLKDMGGNKSATLSGKLKEIFVVIHG